MRQINEKKKLLKFFKKSSSEKIKLDSKKIFNIYLCGPTVYDHIHIGNLRPLIVFDILIRLFFSLNIKICYVQNITDIDDKIISKSFEKNISEKKISKLYIKSYLTNLTRYNIIFPNFFPKVTNYIPEIKKIIKKIIKKGFAYCSNYGVFFDLKKKMDYGVISKQILEKLQKKKLTLSEEEYLTGKKNNNDFALWKRKTDGINWNSPWGKGRPGWHTECVSIINKIFNGKTIDIHGGGQDLLFPHHENERIQFLVVNEKELSNIWLHVSHLNLEGKKMSKSLGNIIYAEFFFLKYGSNVLRFIFLNNHYSNTINFNQKLIDYSRQKVLMIINLIRKVNFFLFIKGKKYPTKIKTKKEIRYEVHSSLLSNLNTVKVISLLEEIISFLNKNINDKDQYSKEIEEEISNFLFILNILGFDFDLIINDKYKPKVKLLIKKWHHLKESKNYIEADKVREKLRKLNILWY